ncbi:MerR family transcriptional regulator, partial [Rhodoblastus sphagnicola]
MEKTTEAFRTIGEVADELDLPQHVLRFWETKFIQIRPVKRAGGRRYYRQDDVALVAAIRVLLYSEGYTIKGVQRILKEQGARAVIAASNAPRAAAPPGAPIRIEPE